MGMVVGENNFAGLVLVADLTVFYPVIVQNFLQGSSLTRIKFQHASDDIPGFTG